MVTNRRLVPTDGPDYYKTPEWGTQVLLDNETFEGKIWEPCCGDGAMSLVLKKDGQTVVSSDICYRGFGGQRDFFDMKGRLDNVVTNPPFNIAEDILHHALKITEQKVCLLLRLAFLEGKGRWERIYSINPPTRVLIFSSRLSIFPASSDLIKGGTTAYAWFVWDRRCHGTRYTQLKWISPR